MSHIYRAYFAIRSLTNQDGLPTNAIYGFTVMLRKLIADEEPDYLGVAFDLKGPTVRHEQFEEYKATRPKMPEDLVEQLPYIRRVCEVFRVPVITHEGYEADDVIGTLTHQAVEQDLEVVIVTIDKDMLQLVNEKVVVLDTRDMTRFDSAEVEKKWGVRPDQIVDVLSLVGDSSDNIPGAPGIGDKGARSLIAEFGTLENLFAHRDDVPRKSYRESLQNNEDLILKSRELLKIYRELPLPLDLSTLRLEEPDISEVRRLFTEMRFTRLLKTLPEETEAGQDEPRIEVKKVSSSHRLKQLSRKVEGKAVGISLWVEGTEAIESETLGVGVCFDPPEAWFISSEFLSKHPESVKDFFSRQAEWIFHDLKGFYFCAGHAGWELGGSVRDTMLAAYLLDPDKKDFSLRSVALEQLGYELGAGASEMLLVGDERPQQLCEKALVTLKICQAQLSLLETQGLLSLLDRVEVPLVKVLADMERVGVRVDVSQLEQMSGEFLEEIETLTVRIRDLAGEDFNLNSPKQLSTILFEKLGFPVRRKKGKAGHFSTGVEVLEELSENHEIARLILEYRELSKLRNTYLDALPKLVNQGTGRIHTSYNQMVAATGRLSSSNPNLQNIPIRSKLGRRIRKAFVARSGCSILSADYSQIELRVMAHLSEDPVLVEAFNRGEDIHERTAREVFGALVDLDPLEMRRRAKVINFGIIYGLSAFGLAKSLKIRRSEAQDYIDGYFERYHGVRTWSEVTLEEAEQNGYVKTLFGRIRQIPDIKSRNRNQREFARRMAINAPIQGTAADLMKMAMVAIHERMDVESFSSKLTMQVHDELVFEVCEEEIERLSRLVVDEMEGVAQLRVPLKVDLSVGPSWYEAK